MTRLELGNGDFGVGIGVNNAFITFNKLDTSAKVGTPVNDDVSSICSVQLEFTNIKSVIVLEKQLKELKRRMRSEHYNKVGK